VTYKIDTFVPAFYTNKRKPRATGITNQMTSCSGSVHNSS